MSLRAIKKRESKPYRKQHQQTQHSLGNGVTVLGTATTTPINRNNRKSFTNPQQLPTGDSESPIQRTNSLPNLSPSAERLLLLQAKKFTPWRSDSDVSRLIEQFEQNVNLISAKSEVCLKTISVHKTIHSSNMNNMSRGGSVSNRDLSATAVRYRGGGAGGGGGGGDALNNNNHPLATRRMSEHSFSAYSHSSNYTTPSEIEVRGFADTSCVRVPIIGYEVMEERARFTVYKLRVENPFSNDCWLVLRRYTDFVRLNNKLKQAFPHVGLQLPRKKLFGDNFNSVFLDNRVQGLQRFVNTIMANNELRNSSVVREFFCLDEPPTYSDSMEECRAIFEAQEETIAHLKLQLKQKDDQILSLQQKIRNEVTEKEELKTKLHHIPRAAKCSNCGNSVNAIVNSS